MDETGSAVLQQVAFFALLILGFYLLAIRPQRSRAKALAGVRAAMEPGSQVITTAGIHASVLETGEETVLLEIAPGVAVRFATAAVVRIVAPTDPTATDPAATDPPA